MVLQSCSTCELGLCKEVRALPCPVRIHVRGLGAPLCLCSGPAAMPGQQGPESQRAIFLLRVDLCPSFRAW